MGLYQITDEAPLPLAVQVGDVWQFHTAHGDVVELDDEAAAAFGPELLRRVDDPNAQPTPPASVVPVPVEQPVPDQPADPEPAKASRRRGAPEPSEPDGN
jgi:hypothetical protein